MKSENPFLLFYNTYSNKDIMFHMCFMLHIYDVFKNDEI